MARDLAAGGKVGSGHVVAGGRGARADAGGLERPDHETAGQAAAGRGPAHDHLGGQRGRGHGRREGRTSGRGGGTGADRSRRAAASLRRKTLREEDFVDNDESNRDPFKSFIRLFIDKGVTTNRPVPAIFDKFALEELSLIAVVSGDAQPRAMFRDPGGLGQTVKRGDYVSKAGARITKILSDRVILEVAETSSTGEPRAIEKAVLVHPEQEAQK